MSEVASPGAGAGDPCPRIAIVAGEWHSAISDGLLSGAESALEEAGCYSEIFPVASSFDLPLVTQVVLQENWDAAVVLGVIIRGESAHFDRLSQVVTGGLADVALCAGKPVGFGILMVDTEKQGLDRAGLASSKEDRGREAAEWAVQTTRLIKYIRGGS